MSFSFFKGIFSIDEGAAKSELSSSQTKSPTASKKELNSEHKPSTSPKSQAPASPKKNVETKSEINKDFLLSGILTPNDNKDNNIPPKKPFFLTAKQPVAPKKPLEQSGDLEKDFMLIPNYIEQNEFDDMIQQKHIFTSTILAKKSVFFEAYLNRNNWLDLRTLPTIRHLASFTYIIPTNQENAEQAYKIIQHALKRCEADPDSTSRFVFIALLKLKILYDQMVSKNQTGTVRQNIEEIFASYQIPVDKERFEARSNTIKRVLGL